jgi:hypothetical protein
MVTDCGTITVPSSTCRSVAMCSKLDRQEVSPGSEWAIAVEYSRLHRSVIGAGANIARFIMGFVSHPKSGDIVYRRTSPRMGSVAGATNNASRRGVGK